MEKKLMNMGMEKKMMEKGMKMSKKAMAQNDMANIAGGGFFDTLKGTAKKVAGHAREQFKPQISALKEMGKGMAMGMLEQGKTMAGNMVTEGKRNIKQGVDSYMDNMGMRSNY